MVVIDKTRVKPRFILPRDSRSMETPIIHTQLHGQSGPRRWLKLGPGSGSITRRSVCASSAGFSESSGSRQIVDFLDTQGISPIQRQLAARRFRKTNSVPENGLSLSVSLQTAARPSTSCRKSTGATATRVRICGVICSINPVSRGDDSAT